MPEAKLVTKEQLIEILKNWPACEYCSLQDIIKAWNDPEYAEQCADYIWQQLTKETK